MRLTQHPNWERKLEIGVGDGASLVEDPLNGFLWPRTILPMMISTF